MSEFDGIYDGPVAFFGGPPGTTFKITSSPWGPIPSVHVPDEEIVLPPDAPVFRIGPDSGQA